MWSALPNPFEQNAKREFCRLSRLLRAAQYVICGYRKVRDF